jgi:hypothetical protein
MVQNRNIYPTGYQIYIINRSDNYMSLRYEQYSSLKQTKDFLRELLQKNMPRSEMKKKIIRALRHYPPLDEKGKPMFSQDEFTEK